MANCGDMEVEVTVDLTIVGQPECCVKLKDAGWKFSFDPETRFVSADHSLGGKQSVVEVVRIGRSGFDVNQIGQCIAMVLNGGKDE